MNAQDFAAQLQQRKQKNLEFFNKYFPNIFQRFHELTLKNAQLNLDPNTFEVNLVENDKAIYPLEATAFNKDEAHKFSDHFKVGYQNRPVRRSSPDNFYQGRYSHICTANFLRAVDSVAGPVKPFVFRHSMPLVVFYGSGLGIHVAELLKIRDVRHCILVEHNPDRFLASLYVTDWEEVVFPYLIDKTRSFVFSVGDTTHMNDDERVFQAFAGAWNIMANNVPFLPVQASIYVHQADSFYSKAAQKINKETQPHVNVWGYYDDEVNQMNHVFHNIEQGIPVFKKIDISTNTKVTIVCGNGPSLDTYLPLIKKYRHKLYVIAAGSATHSLLKNDIYPDFMATLESDYATYQALTMLPAEKAKKIPLIGAAQIAPETFGLFSDSLMYLKYETTYARFFEKNNDTIAHGTPSASNAALAIALDLNPSKLFLVGTDFGFLDPCKTHSDSSFYAEDDKQEEFEAFKKRITDDTYKVQTNKRGDVYTTAFYNTARIHAERKIRNSGNPNVINLSLGATIEGTKENSTEDFTNFIENIAVNASEPPLFDLLKPQATKITRKDLSNAIKAIEFALNKLKSEYLGILSELEPNLDSIETTVYKLNLAITSNKELDVHRLQMSIRGAIWHWIFNFYALCKEVDGEQKLDVFVREFKNHFGGFMNYLPAHFLNYVSQRTKDDPKLKLSVAEPEPNIDEWLAKVESFDFALFEKNRKTIGTNRKHKVKRKKK